MNAAHEAVSDGAPPAEPAASATSDGAPPAEPAASATAVELGSIDGHIAPSSEMTIPATDEGLLRGDGVFEVIRVYGGTPFALVQHLDRLERSAGNLRLPEVFRPELEAEIPELLAARGGAEFDGVLRIVVTRGGRRLLFTEQAAIMPPGVRLGIVTYAPTRVLDGIKSLSYGSNMLASRLAKERGFDEALLVTPHGRVLEGPTWTFFWVRDGALLTPPLEDRILASITRAKVLEDSGGTEAVCTLDDLRAADEAFIASTVREVMPIAAVDEIQLPAAPGPVPQRAGEQLRDRIERELA